jgi:hypothetical protein
MPNNNASIVVASLDFGETSPGFGAAAAFCSAGVDTAAFGSTGFDTAVFGSAGFDTVAFDAAGVDPAAFSAADFDAAACGPAGFDTVAFDAGAFGAAGVDAVVLGAAALVDTGRRLPHAIQSSANGFVSAPHAIQKLLPVPGLAPQPIHNSGLPVSSLPQFLQNMVNVPRLF